VNIEKAQWDEAWSISEAFGIEHKKINQYYIEATVSVNKLLA
jgi:hypothetical protein